MDSRENEYDEDAYEEEQNQMNSALALNKNKQIIQNTLEYNLGHQGGNNGPMVKVVDQNISNQVVREISRMDHIVFKANTIKVAQEVPTEEESKMFDLEDMKIVIKKDCSKTKLV